MLFMKKNNKGEKYLTPATSAAKSLADNSISARQMMIDFKPFEEEHGERSERSKAYTVQRDLYNLR